MRQFLPCLGIASSIVLGYLATISPATAQIVPDNTLGVNSLVTPLCTVCTINGGTVRGVNLFHSFSEFSVPTGGEAFFNNGLHIQNILTRVTGNSVSNIDGLLRANGTANLFLINPNGIIFRQNATLNIGGSFVASTASSLVFADGTLFSAAPTTSTTPLLTVSVPLGLQFGGNQGRILVQGNGQGIRTTPRLIDTTFGLRVQPNQTLALVGGDLALKGATLKTAGGRIELGSVAGVGLVSLTPTAKGFALGYQGVPTYGDIHLSQRATVDASGEGGGDIQVRGKRLTVTGSSIIEASTLGAGTPGSFDVVASESVEVIGRSADNNFASALAALVYRGAKGAGDNLRIETGQLIVQDRAVVNTGTSGDGPAGNLHVTATESVEVIGNSPNGQYPSGLFSQVERGAKGKGGNITIETGHLSVRDGAEISTGTFGRGQAGNLKVTATESVEVIGNLPNGQSPSGLFSQVEPRAKGAGGNITIETGHLSVRDGAEVSASTAGKGSSGNLHVTATESVEVIGRSTNGKSPSDLNTEVEKGAKGAGGDLTIETGHLSVRDGAQVTASTAGKGSSGNLHVAATESVEVIGSSADGQEPSGLTASTKTAGDAKNLTIETGHLTVQDGAEITVSSKGLGKAGQLEVTANSVLLDKGQLIAETVSGTGGNIKLQVEDLLLMRNNSLISAQASNNGNGGNINIKPGLIVAIPAEDSDIVADANQGKGGNIDITTQGIFGLELRKQRTPESDITASSNVNLPGTISITRLEVDPSPGIATLPTNLVEQTSQISQGCSAGGENRENKFTVTGRGGLPQSPNEVLSPDLVQDDFGTLATETETRTDATPSPRPTNSPKQLVEAQGWMIGSDGKVILTATAPNVTPQQGWQTPANCKVSHTSSSPVQQ